MLLNSHERFTTIAFALSLFAIQNFSYAASEQQSSPKAQSRPGDVEDNKENNADADRIIYAKAVDAYNSKNYTKAAELLEPISEKGSGDVQALLGMIYHFGETDENRLAKALQWYEKAYENGMRGAIANNIGSLYQNGYGGIERDAIKAEQFLRNAGENNFAYLNIARLYLESPEFFNKTNLLSALQYAKEAEKLGNVHSKDIISTIECALNPNTRRDIGWFNAQGLEAYDLAGHVMKVEYSIQYIDNGFLLFGKSGNLIAHRGKFGHTTLYRYDKSCNLITKIGIDPDKGSSLGEVRHQYIGNRLNQSKFSNGSSHYSYSKQPDDSVFVTENIVTKLANGSDYKSTESKHYDRSGLLIWSNNNAYPAFRQSIRYTRTLIHSGGSFYPSIIKNDNEGRVTYDKGFIYTYTPNGLLLRVTDRAGDVGQMRSVLEFEYNPKKLLKREIYREIGAQQNFVDETTYDEYQMDSGHNWKFRRQKYQHEGKPQIIEQHRIISYWEK